MSNESNASNQTEKAGRPPLGLIALNVGLAAAVAWTVFEPSAIAQQSQRGRGEYILLGGVPEGGNSNDVFVIDTKNQEMVGLRWDRGTRRLIGIGYRDIDADTKAPKPR